MSKQEVLELRPQPLAHGGDAVLGVHPQDRVYSGMFGHGQVVELLKDAEGHAYGHRIRFENGMEAELLITDLPVRH